MEFIGALGLFVLALVIAAAFGALLSNIAEKRIPENHPQRRSITSRAFALPILTALYLLFCLFFAFLALMPNETQFMFGDINEPLPNGYTLRAIGKMPDLATIAPPDGKPVPPLGWVSRISLDQSKIFGQLGYFDPTERKPDSLDFFALDTTNHHVQYFATLSELNSKAGHTVVLIPNSQFHSPIHQSQRLQITALEWLLAIGPPAALTALYFRSIAATQKS